MKKLLPFLGAVVFTTAIVFHTNLHAMHSGKITKEEYEAATSAGCYTQTLVLLIYFVLSKIIINTKKDEKAAKQEIPE